MTKRLAKWLAIQDSRYLKGRLALARWTPSLARYWKVMRMTKSPILVGGCGRSGTTFLLALLSAHQHVYSIPRETRAFCNQGYRSPPTSPTFRMGPIYDALCQAEDLAGVTRWCEKTPKNVVYIREILDYFGAGARFLNIVRDGRDVVTSIHRMGDGYWVPPSRWVEDVASGRDMETNPQVLTIRYEDLIADMSATMHRVCDFLGEPYDPGFDSFPASASMTTMGPGGARVQRPHQKSVGRWKEAKHQHVVEELMSLPKAQELLSHYGYI